MKTATSLCLLLILSSLLTLHGAGPAVNCGDVAVKSAACIGFVTGKAAKPSLSCCGGLKALAREATTPDARRGICRCMKNGVKAFPGVQDRLLGQVPRVCSINVGFPVSLNTNCDKIN